MASASTDVPGATTLFHVTHWKAGSQWIHKILESLAPGRIVTPRTGEGQFLHDPIVRGHIYPTLYVTREQFDAVALPPDARRFVVLRDLRDTLVSAYFSFRYSHGLIASGLANVYAELESRGFEDGLIFLAEKWLPAAASIQSSWLAAGEPVLWYEDLLVDDEQLLREALVVRGGLEVGAEEFRRAVEANRFAALTGGRPAGKEDIKAHERKGVAGDWKNHFTRRLHKRFDDLYGSLIAAGERTRVTGGAAGATLPARPGLDPAEVLRSYDLMAARNPNLPTYCLWQAWEHAAFAHFPTGGRVLDLGCSDPAYFRLNCPQAQEAIGASTEATYCEWASQSGIYREVIEVKDFSRLEVPGGVDGVFTRMTLNQVRRVAPVLEAVRRCLRPGGSLLCTVLTARHEDWSLLPRIIELAGYRRAGAAVRRDQRKFHRIARLLPPAEWERVFAASGFTVDGRIPIVPRFTANVLLLIDTLWHRPAGTSGEFGDEIIAFLSARPKLRSGVRGLIAAIMDMESDWDDTAAVVYRLRAAPK